MARERLGKGSGSCGRFVLSTEENNKRDWGEKINTFNPAVFFKMLVSNVVLPVPKKPLMMVTGTDGMLICERIF